MSSRLTYQANLSSSAQPSRPTCWTHWGVAIRVSQVAMISMNSVSAATRYPYHTLTSPEAGRFARAATSDRMCGRPSELHILRWSSEICLPPPPPPPSSQLSCSSDLLQVYSLETFVQQNVASSCNTVIKYINIIWYVIYIYITCILCIVVYVIFTWFVPQKVFDT